MMKHLNNKQRNEILSKKATTTTYTTLAGGQGAHQREKWTTRADKKRREREARENNREKEERRRVEEWGVTWRPLSLHRRWCQMVRGGWFLLPPQDSCLSLLWLMHRPSHFPFLLLPIFVFFNLMGSQRDPIRSLWTPLVFFPSFYYCSSFFLFSYCYYFF